MNSILIAPPAAEPVSLAEAKAWLRIDTNDEDDAIVSLIAAARASVEAATRRALVAQTWRLALDRWPFLDGADGALALLAGRRAAPALEAALPLAPVLSVSGVRIYDSGGQPQTVPANLWRLVGAPEKARILFSAAPPNPGLPAAGIEIDVVAGYGAPADAPAPLRQAVLALVAHAFENRGDVDGDALPRRVAALIAPYRRGRLA